MTVETWAFLYTYVKSSSTQPMRGSKLRTVGGRSVGGIYARVYGIGPRHVLVLALHEGVAKGSLFDEAVRG